MYPYQNNKYCAANDYCLFLHCVNVPSLEREDTYEMQTFLPYASFEDVARTLDRKRLGKQRVEGMQILNVLAKPPGYTGAWANHPAVKMWRGYENALKQYVNTMMRNGNAAATRTPYPIMTLRASEFATPGGWATHACTVASIELAAQRAGLLSPVRLGHSSRPPLLLARPITQLRSYLGCSLQKPHQGVGNSVVLCQG